MHTGVIVFIFLLSPHLLLVHISLKRPFYIISRYTNVELEAILQRHQVSRLQISISILTIILCSIPKAIIPVCKLNADSSFFRYAVHFIRIIFSFPSLSFCFQVVLQSNPLTKVILDFKSHEFIIPILCCLDISLVTYSFKFQK